jgi:hypothetical protein
LRHSGHDSGSAHLSRSAGSADGRDRRSHRYRS